MKRLFDEGENLSDTEHRVLFVIASHFNQEGTCFPSVARIASKARRDPRSVQRALRKLSSGDRPWLIRRLRTGRSTLYEWVAAPAALAAAKVCDGPQVGPDAAVLTCSDDPSKADDLFAAAAVESAPDPRHQCHPNTVASNGAGSPLGAAPVSPPSASTDATPGTGVTPPPAPVSPDPRHQRRPNNVRNNETNNGKSSGSPRLREGPKASRSPAQSEHDISLSGEQVGASPDKHDSSTAVDDLWADARDATREIRERMEAGKRDRRRNGRPGEFRPLGDPR